MSNYKIRVNSKAESKEAQELFFELGYEKGVCSTGGYPALIIATPESRFQKTPYSSRATSLNHEAHSQYKEITIPELRDMVVLNRNDPKDATHYRNDGKEYFQTCDKERHYHFQDDAWVLSTWMNYQLLPQLKPIEKKEMKEYLVELNEVYILVENDRKLESHWIEIPEGAEVATKADTVISFWKDSGVLWWDRIEKKWCKYSDLNHHIEKCGHEIIWQRPTHPEELPFVDDEPLLQTEIESELDQVENLRELLTPYTPPLNDQYAEIEKVSQTLNQRQEQYGSFEDVAMITEQMVDVMRKGYYENLAYNQKMALYMICSKMARIVNGNPNHKDSWHDIAGYATLIDSELVSEKDMLF